jgi:riboflavin biosynthesis pyrimidine reductase
MFAQLLPFDVGSVLLEGGAQLHGAAFREGLIDRLHVVITPHRIGETGVRWLEWDALPWLTCSARVEPIGPDVWMEANVHRAH